MFQIKNHNTDVYPLPPFPNTVFVFHHIPVVCHKTNDNTFIQQLQKELH